MEINSNRMAESTHRLKVLREWAPLTDLFNKLPTRTQNGILYQEVHLTCVDVLPEFIALGTNAGVVYWYNRKKKDLSKLRCENTKSAITVIKVVSTVDYMLACGDALGNVTIFQIPKSHPENLPENLKPKNKVPESYTISALHKSAITALEWSKNGMKLFSGDKNGIVVLNELDFYMHIVSSVEILNETYEVVQLSYHLHKLLISTTYRSIICQKQDKWRISQIGRQDRKVLGKFGAIFYNNGIGPNDVIMYCIRPRLRVWMCDITGFVQQTLLYKEAVYKDDPEVTLINPISSRLKSLRPPKEPSFGKVLIFHEDLLVTYGSDVLYVLNPKDMAILHIVKDLRGILCVACNKDEIFILEEHRSLIRLAYEPETANQESYSTSTVNTFSPISSSFKEFTNKLQSSNVVSAISSLAESPENVFNIHTDMTSVVNAEEATEYSYAQNWHSDSSDSKILNNVKQTKKAEIYKKIAEEDFDDSIIFKHHRHKKPVNMASSLNSLSSASSDEHDGRISKHTLMNFSTVTILPDLRSPDSILNDIEQKEKILADILNFDKIKINPDNLRECDSLEATPSVDKNSTKKFNEIANEAPTVDCSEPAVVPKSSDSADNTKNNLDSKNSEFSKCKDMVKTCDNFDTPVKIIPNEWNLSSVQLIKERRTSESDNSLADWEII